MDITEFLLARIAEDERQAGICRELGWGPGRKYGVTVLSPARVVAECAAKRAIAAHHEPVRDFVYNDGDWATCSICTETGPNAQGWPCLTVAALAAVYKDHPDYQQEWANG